jgi:hypothetical protein
MNLFDIGGEKVVQKIEFLDVNYESLHFWLKIIYRWHEGETGSNCF